MTTWPADRFYWAMLDVSSLPPRLLGRPSPRRLGYLFERYLPAPIESVHAAYTMIEKGRVLACAVDRARLDQDCPSDAIALAPRSPPPFIDADVSGLNLLVGDYEPESISRRRARWRFELAAALVLIAAVILAGMHRRAQRHEAHLAATSAALAEVYDETLGPAEPSAQPASLRLTAELRRLQQTRGGVAVEPASAASGLAALLAPWPADLDVRTESVVVTESSMTLVVLLADNEEVQRFAASIAGVEDWTMIQPQVRSVRDGVRATIRFQRGSPS
jgi:hypothetical protein